MPKQSWDRADFSCGRCGHRFTATTEAEYVRLYAEHRMRGCEALTEGGMGADTVRHLADLIEAWTKSSPRMTVRRLVVEMRTVADRIDADRGYLRERIAAANDKTAAGSQATGPEASR